MHPSMQNYDLVVIGSGPGGQKAAIAAAKLGKTVAVIERDLMLGGVWHQHRHDPVEDSARGGAVPDWHHPTSARR
jgi:cation diffusion facilitator CzcD-associated flavoprotein CzcO